MTRGDDSPRFFGFVAADRECSVAAEHRAQRLAVGGQLCWFERGCQGHSRQAPGTRSDAGQLERDAFRIEPEHELVGSPVTAMRERQVRHRAEVRRDLLAVPRRSNRTPGGTSGTSRRRSTTSLSSMQSSPDPRRADHLRRAHYLRARPGTQPVRVTAAQQARFGPPGGHGVSPATEGRALGRRLGSTIRSLLRRQPLEWRVGRR
jgi:hypothetical protein